MSSFETLQAKPPNPPDSITHPDGGVAAGQSGETLQRRTRKNLVPSRRRTLVCNLPQNWPPVSHPADAPT